MYVIEILTVGFSSQDATAQTQTLIGMVNHFKSLHKVKKIKWKQSGAGADRFCLTAIITYKENLESEDDV